MGCLAVIIILACLAFGLVPVAAFLVVALIVLALLDS